ncbi:hypothetical protein CBER1_04029 [Cercospora berteroae]|uniref:Uncharacterized protein n=1 Tax=Cercospora berteroae TaxID=357750 RepID=A0A2S6C4Y9_9PEZI|nr:hypothetical protein CBER1_04029 [Cercospora berteroae]
MLLLETDLVRTTAILFTLSILASLVYSALLTPLRKIPGPPLARFTNFWIAWKSGEGRSHLLWRELHAKYGPLVRTGPKRVLFNNPELLATIYGAGSNYVKSDFYDSFQAELKDGTENELPSPSRANLFSNPDVTYHKRMKAAIAPAYSLSSLKQLEPMADDCTKLFMDKLKQFTADSVVSLDEWLHFYAFDVVGMITFMQPFGMLEKGRDDFGLGTHFDALAYMSVVGLIPGLHDWLIGNARLLRFLNSFKSFRENNIALKVRDAVYTAMRSYRKSENRDRGDYISYLHNFQANNPSKLSDRDIIDSLMINVFVGSDTTAFSLTACFYYLVKNPQTYAKIRAEIDEADAANKLSLCVSFAEANELTYLRVVLKEVLRLFPAVTMPLERVVPAGGLLVTIPNPKNESKAETVHLPAGTRIGAAPNVLNTLPSVFGPDALEFRPERWLQASPEQLSKMERCYFTFGNGSRICIGRHIVTMEAMKLVPQLLRHFDFEWVCAKAEEWKVEGYWMSRPSGLKVRIKERKT